MVLDVIATIILVAAAAAILSAVVATLFVIWEEARGVVVQWVTIFIVCVLVFWAMNRLL